MPQESQFSQAAPWRERIFFFVCLAGALIVLGPLWQPIGAGIILGYFTEPPLRWLTSRFALRRRGRALAAGLLLVFALCVCLFPIAFALYRALHDLAAWLGDPTLLSGDSARYVGSLADVVQSILSWLHSKLNAWGVPIPLALLTELGSHIGAAGSALVRALLAGLRSTAVAAPRAILYTVIAIVSWWLAALEGATLRARVLPWLVPWPQPRAILGRAVTEVLRGLVVANIAVAAVQAVICVIGLSITGIPYAVSLGVMCFFLAFVPVVGTALVTVGAALYLFSHGRFGAGLAMLALALIAGTIDNILRPFFLRGQVELPIAWIFLSIMGGIAGFGVSGVVLGPIVLATCRQAFRALEEESPLQDQTPATPAATADMPRPETAPADRPADPGNPGDPTGSTRRDDV